MYELLILFQHVIKPKGTIFGQYHQHGKHEYLKVFRNTCHYFQISIISSGVNSLSVEADIVILLSAVTLD